MLVQFLSFSPKLYFIVQGVTVTLQYSLVSAFFGILLGTILAICKVAHYRFLRVFAVCYTSIFRGTPLLIQLSIIYFALPSLIGVKLNPFTAGVIAFSLNSGAYVSEIIRAGINAVERGQIDAAQALGIPRALIMKDIILPQAVRNILPALANELISLVKESALVSTIGGMEIMRRAQIVSAETFNFFLPMIMAAITYYIMVTIITICAHCVEKRLAL